jgi:hypothetical protein
MRHWTALGNNGETYTDAGYQNAWKERRARQP